MDCENILYIVIVTDNDGEMPSYASASKMTATLPDCLSDNAMPHIPVTYQIADDDWPNFQKAFVHAIIMAIVPNIAKYLR